MTKAKHNKTNKEQPVGTLLRPADRLELQTIAATQDRTLSWLIAEIVHRVLSNSGAKAWLKTNPTSPLPLVVSALPVDKAKLHVMSRLNGKSVSTNASDLIHALLNDPQVRAQLRLEAEKQLASDPTFDAAKQVLQSYGVSPTPAPEAAAPPAAAPAEPVEQPVFLADGLPISPEDLEDFFTRPPTQQRPVTTIAGAHKEETSAPVPPTS